MVRNYEKYPIRIGIRLQKHHYSSPRAPKRHVKSTLKVDDFRAWILSDLESILAPKRHPQTTMEVIKILIKKELNSEEGLGGCGQVWHYTPGVKFAREGGDLGGCPTTFQHASSLSRRKVGGFTLNTCRRLLDK